MSASTPWKSGAKPARCASPIRPNFLSRYMPSYAREMDHFADVLAGRAKPQVGYAEGLAALAWAEACAESARTNAVVKL